MGAQGVEHNLTMCIFCERAANQLASGITPGQKKEAEQCGTLQEKRVRATVLTGFLGSGKTTFLNFVLQSRSHGKKFAVVQNEFGSVAVDDDLMLLEKNETEVITMPNGCLCCRVRGDLVEALRRLAGVGGSPDGVAVTDRFDGLIIECSGLSEVAPVAQTFFADAYVQAAFKLDGIVCMCDAANFDSMDAEIGTGVSRLLWEQLAISDVCLLNKCDLVEKTARDALSARIRQTNPGLTVIPCRHGKVNLGQVFGTFSLDSVLAVDKHFLEGSQGPGDLDAHGHTHGHPAHTHLAFTSVGFEHSGVIDLDAFTSWIKEIVDIHAEKLPRIKGVLRTGSGVRLVIQGVGGHIEMGEEARESGGGHQSRLVFIGQLDAELKHQLAQGFERTIRAVED